MKKLNLNKLLLFQTIAFALVFAYSLFKISEWQLFPWLNISIGTGLPFIALLFSLLVKMSSKRIILVISICGFIHLLINFYFLASPDLMRCQWPWLIFPILIIINLMYVELFSRKNNVIKKIGTTFTIILSITMLIRFILPTHEMDYLTLAVAALTTALLIFSKNKEIINE